MTTYYFDHNCLLTNSANAYFTCEYIEDDNGSNLCIQLEECWFEVIVNAIECNVEWEPCISMNITHIGNDKIATNIKNRVMRNLGTMPIEQVLLDSVKEVAPLTVALKAFTDEIHRNVINA